MRITMARNLLMATTAFYLAACGGGGGGGGGALVSTPPPPPPPLGSSAVEIFPAPATQQFADFSTGTDIDIRYNATTGVYEVMAGSLPWTRLVDDPLASPQPGNPNVNFALDGAGQNQSYFMIRAHHTYPSPDVKYLYSNIAAWGAGASVTGGAAISGYSAFGIPTPAGSVPVTGSASYDGFIEGRATVDFQYDSELVPAWVTGTVGLDFDFGSGTLAGLIEPYLQTLDTYALPPLAFSNTVFGVGSTTFSGTFATGVSGPNSFSGMLTGPNAQELIGKWAFPFLSPIDGAAESAEGVWIAKRP